MVYKKKYSWGTVNRAVSADVVGNVLERLEDENGCVERKAFLDISRPVDSPTHCLFEWDDSVAAERYRLDQSRKIINDLELEVVACEGESDTVHLEVTQDASALVGRRSVAFINCGDSRQSKVRYNNIVQAMSDEESRANVLRHALTELRMFQRKYNNCNELAGIFAEIERLLAKGA